MKNIVISLESATERQEHIKNEFGKHSVEFEFFDALSPDSAIEYAQSLGIEVGQNITATELACMMSHVAAWQHIIENNLTHAAIYEDDIYLGEDAKQLLNSDSWIKPDWHIIKIEAFSKRAFLSARSHEILANKRKIVALEGKNLGAAGYILSAHGAKLLLDFVLQRPAQPVDRLIFSHFIKEQSEPVYQMLPALCEQEKILKRDKSEQLLPSALTAERQLRRKAEKKRGLAKLKLEANRLVTQSKKALFAKKIVFK